MILFFYLSLLTYFIEILHINIMKHLIIKTHILVGIILYLSFYVSAAQKDNATNHLSERTIQQLETIEVRSTVGTAPRLPYQIWVTYAHGKSEYRQVKWTNAARQIEEDQANPHTHPVGTTYTVAGFILGDNTTDNGYPVTAKVEVVAEPTEYPAPNPVASTLPLNKVQLIGDNRLTSNRELAIQEIISWDVSQQLYNYRDTYGLSTEGYPQADGWDSPTTKLKGHGSGHYMSALALAFASATQADQKDILRDNMTRMVNELRACQERTFVWNDDLGRYWEARDFAPEDELREMQGTWADFDIYKTEWTKYGYGYLNAIPAQHAALIEMYRAYNNDSWVWAPYYSIHKQLAGLIDIATYIDDKATADKALLTAKDMGLWIWNRLHYRTFVQIDGSQEERRSKPGNRFEMWNMYIAGEDGGTGESLARLSEMVSDPTEKARLLEASNFFDSPAFYDPLSKNIDDIRTRHANQHIPKIISALRSYIGNQNPYYYHLSQNFWEMIQGRYRYATGGVGNGEMFRQPYTQMLSMITNGSPTLNETCCAYNLAKLTKDLNTYHPDDARYMDYYERLLYNQLVGSLHPTHYMTTYQYAVGLNASKPWGNRTPQSTCCGGTGSENHTKYQEAAYFVNDNTLWVALYLPTMLEWDAKGITLQQDCEWPAERSTIKLTGGTARFTMKLRVPYWATEGFDIKLNGISIAKSYQPSSYISIPTRDWTQHDVVEIVMPFSKHIDYGPDQPENWDSKTKSNETKLSNLWIGTLMYGPLSMTATGVDTQENAVLTIDSYLDNIITNGADGSKGTNGNLYTLSVGDKTFEPDYYRDEHATHYFRINVVSDMRAEFLAMLSRKIEDAKVFQSNTYTQLSYRKLNKSLREARKVYKSKTSTQNQINNQIALIEQAQNELITQKINKSILSNTIQLAVAKEEKDYTWDNYGTLQKSIERAYEIEKQSESQLLIDKQILILQKDIEALVPVRNINKLALKDLLSIAQERIKEQEAWNKLVVKVPEHAPWAPHAFRRLSWEVSKAENIYDNKDRNYTQSEVNTIASALNTAINTMRPGNLPELEDLYPLRTLLRQAGRLLSGEKTPEISEAIEYAQMVVDYVNDGSGTHDMIENATTKLREALK